MVLALITPDFLLVTVMKSLESKSTHESSSERALRYIVALSRIVDRDTSRRLLIGESTDVYEGSLQLEGMKVSVKTIRAYPPDTQEAIENFLREVHLWSNLNHKRMQLRLGISRTNPLVLALCHEFGPICMDV